MVSIFSGNPEKVPSDRRGGRFDHLCDQAVHLDDCSERLVHRSQPTGWAGSDDRYRHRRPPLGSRGEKEIAPTGGTHQFNEFLPIIEILNLKQRFEIS